MTVMQLKFAARTYIAISQFSILTVIYYNNMPINSYSFPLTEIEDR